MAKEPIIKIMETAEKLEAVQKRIEELKKEIHGENIMNLGIAYNPCSKCEEKSNCNICELTYYRKGALSMENRKTLAEIGIGETCRIGEREYTLCEHTAEGSVLLMRECLYDSEKFGENNNYNGSNVDKLCEEFADRLEKVIGAENIVPHVVDLTADDGLKDYGTIERRVSLFTANQYRKYCDILDKYRLDKWTWTATAYSTPKHGDAAWVKCVSPRGFIINYDCIYCDCGVRPFLILKSSISVS